ncbi:YqxA family protein [Ectobacillus ponti]|uniref:YqxA family protein n=1 Tax=Ectobacillus ponti TaxID=2961894 RepID=A0AA42BR95_9BACI|nr:YqxA family protein [Ectobacillus ponti]MCP8967183.1 YqxA family protein [Ectobacillus ponti]
MKFFVRCLVVMAVLLVSVLCGMQLANDGLKRMKGYNDPTFEQVAHITGTEDGNVEATLLGHTVTIEEKQRRLEELRSFNAVAKTGDFLALGVQKAARFSTDIVISKIKEIFAELNK